MMHQCPTCKAEGSHPFLFDAIGGVFWSNGKFIKFTVQEAMILGVLIDSLGVAVPRQQIIRAVWGTVPPRTATTNLTTMLGRLRNKLRSTRMRVNFIPNSGFMALFE